MKESPKLETPATPEVSAKTLYVVATPIGNLLDLSPRAISILDSVQLILAEDTRHFKKLATRFGIRTAVTSFHEHNESQRVEECLTRLGSGDAIALVSDAGTPAISDPGYRLLRACRDNAISGL